MDQKNLVKFLGLWIVNSILLLIFTVIFPDNIVLGNATTTKTVASVLSGLILTIGVYVVPTLTKKLDLKIKLNDEKTTVVSYFVANAVLLWVLKRLADFTGLGIGNIIFLLILAIVAAVVQVGFGKYIARTLKK